MTAPQPTVDPLAALEEGIRRFDAGDAAGAHAQLSAAYRRAAREPRVLSWYGLTLVLVERNSNLGVALCDQALRLSGPEPELVLNLARAHLALHQGDRVMRVLLRGVEANPDHPALAAALEAMGRRRRPILGALARSHPLNRALGKLRHRWLGAVGRRGVTPLTLGRLHPPARNSDG